MNGYNRTKSREFKAEVAEIQAKHCHRNVRLIWGFFGHQGLDFIALKAAGKTTPKTQVISMEEKYGVHCRQKRIIPRMMGISADNVHAWIGHYSKWGIMGCDCLLADGCWMPTQSLAQWLSSSLYRGLTYGGNFVINFMTTFRFPFASGFYARTMGVVRSPSLSDFMSSGFLNVPETDSQHNSIKMIQHFIAAVVPYQLTPRTAYVYRDGAKGNIMLSSQFKVGKPKPIHPRVLQAIA
jgi:hypothetical protein